MPVQESIESNESIAKRLETYFRETLNIPNAEVTCLANLNAGWETDIYSFDLVLGDGSLRKLIIRAYPGIGRNAEHSAKARKEFYLLSKLWEDGYPVPKMWGADCEGKVFGRPFTVMERISGLTISSAASTASPERIKELINIFCGLWVKLHKMDWRKVTAGLEEYIGWHYAPELPALVERIIGLLTHYNGTRYSGFYEWLRREAAGVALVGPALVHGDFHDQNIILTDDDRPYVVDWGQLGVMDYRYDIAWTFALLGAYNPPETLSAILSRYEEIAGGPVQSLDYFLALANGTRLFYIAAAIREGSSRLGLREGLEDNMRRNSSRLRYNYEVLREKTGLRFTDIEDLLDYQA